MIINRPNPTRDYIKEIANDPRRSDMRRPFMKMIEHQDRHHCLGGKELAEIFMMAANLLNKGNPKKLFLSQALTETMFVLVERFRTDPEAVIHDRYLKPILHALKDVKHVFNATEVAAAVKDVKLVPVSFPPPFKRPPSDSYNPFKIIQP